MGRGRRGVLTQSHKRAIPKNTRDFLKEPEKNVVRIRNEVYTEKNRVEITPEIINFLACLDPAVVANFLTS